MERLSRSLDRNGANAVCPADYPVKVMQFGEGNFLRAFVDWMIDLLNEKTDFNGSIRLVQPLPQGMADMINAQQGCYTLLLRGIENGRAAEDARIIRSVRDCLNPYTQWGDTVRCALGKELRFIVSNTTEAGIEYKEQSYDSGVCPDTFPAKVASLLYARFLQFGGDAERGLVFLPCELIEFNGDKLKACVLRHAADWKFGDDFARWVESANTFCNTLVDRIVAGYPRSEAAALEQRFGYADSLIDCGEFFHLWVIEGDAELGKELPFTDIGLNVVWTDNLKPYRDRKVRFLNGAHTANVLAAYLGGCDLVDQMMDDEVFGAMVRKTVFEEIAPTVALPEAEKNAFAEAVMERFRNPYAGHQLLSISLNSISKWKVRVLPSLLDYVKLKGRLPAGLTFSLAALITFYHAEASADGKFTGVARAGGYPVADDADKVAFMAAAWREAGDDFEQLASKVLARTDFWETDLNAIPGFAAGVAAILRSIRQLGVRAAASAILGNK